MAAIVEGGQVSDAKVRELEGIDGVESVQAGPSADGEVIGVGIELAGNLSDGEEEETASAVEAALRDIDAETVLVGGELLIDEEFSERAEKDAATRRAHLVADRARS